MSSARRAFLKQAGISAAALAAIPSLARAESSDASPQAWSMSLHGEFEALEQQQQEAWDTTWTQRVSAKHKAMFDVPEIADGIGVFRGAIWGAQYIDALKVTPADLSTVIVIRHSGIPLAMNQDFWTTYNVGKQFKIKGEDGKVIKYNPVLAAPGAPAPTGMMATAVLDAQISKGAIVLACNLAFRSIVATVQKQDKLTPPEAREKAKSMLVPGVILQPSGIFANVLAQECGCAFVNAV
ncbi:hypothetical protein [Gemmatimonas aurantiaca]|uniref:hypothetical protein n=1 Tax=Gemmatimonas aurantiaca TaxID=173480 RepID=UPI00301BEBE4